MGRDGGRIQKNYLLKSWVMLWKVSSINLYVTFSCLLPNVADVAAGVGGGR